MSSVAATLSDKEGIAGEGHCREKYLTRLRRGVIVVVASREIWNQLSNHDLSGQEWNE